MQKDKKGSRMAGKARRESRKRGGKGGTKERRKRGKYIEKEGTRGKVGRDAGRKGKKK